MNWLNKLSARTIRLVFTILAVYALIIGSINFVRVMVIETTSNDECLWVKEGRPDSTGVFIRQVMPGGVADKAGLKDGDLLIAINGQRFKDGNGAQRILNRVGAKETAVYLIERNGEQMEVQITVTKVFNLLYLSIAILGLAFLVIGYIVGMTKPQESAQQIFYFLGLMFMLQVGGMASPSAPVYNTILLIDNTASNLLLPPLFLHFFLHFPVKRDVVVKRRWFVPLLYGVSLLNIGMLVCLRFIARIDMSDSLFPIAARVVYFLYILVGFLLFISSYRKIRTKEARRPLSIILWGTALGLASVFYFIVMGAVMPLSQIFIFHQALLSPALLIIAIPVSFGYAIFKYRLMDIEIVVKKSLVYSLITANIAVIYLVLVFGIGQLLGGMLGEENNKIMTVLAIIVIAFVFDPVKRRVQSIVDRLFYRERYNYQKALLEFSQELPRLIDLHKIVDSVAATISKTMHIENVFLSVYDKAKDEWIAYVKRETDVQCHFKDGEGSLVKLLKDTRTAQFFYRLKDESESNRLHPDDREMIIRANVVLSIPMLLQNRLTGILNLGPKLSGKIYSQEDVDLLTTVASQAAIAIENARLHLEELEKQKIEKELETARRIQQGLLPKENPKIEGLDVSGISIPATSVGGDYFDFIELDEKHLVVIVGDVSGKGMSAALYMSKIQGMVQLASGMYSSPRDILVEVNRKIYDGIERNSFITMIVALFDLEEHKTIICRAGHNPVLLSVNGTISSLKMKGIGLGLEEGSIFEQELEQMEKTFAPGNTFIFYSDGLTEAMNRDQVEFGEDRVVELVRSNIHLNAAEIQQKVIAEVERFRGDAEQNDDITVVVVKCR